MDGLRLSDFGSEQGEMALQALEKAPFLATFCRFSRGFSAGFAHRVANFGGCGPEKRWLGTNHAQSPSSALRSWRRTDRRCKVGSSRLSPVLCPPIETPNSRDDQESRLR